MYFQQMILAKRMAHRLSIFCEYVILTCRYLPQQKLYTLSYDL